MPKGKFDINKDFEITSFDGMHECKNRIMCDYLAKVTIDQNGKCFFGEVGYVGRNRMSTKPKYLFVADRIYALDDIAIERLFDFNDSEFFRWLMF